GAARRVAPRPPPGARLARPPVVVWVGMRVLITGITGFVGSHLAEYALAQGAEVIGSSRWRSKTEHVEHLRDRISLVDGDLRDLLSVRALLTEARPDYIVHLAAQSFVVASWTTPSETLWTNAICQLNLFEGMRQLGSTAISSPRATSRTSATSCAGTGRCSSGARPARSTTSARGSTGRSSAC